MDDQLKKLIGICVAVGVLSLSLGVIIGYFSGHKAKHPYKIGNCDLTSYPQLAYKYAKKYIKQSKERVCILPGETCNSHELPKSYIAYHLNGQSINIDGHLDDPAWQQVPWTDDFLDIRSTVYPNPRLQTKAKVRWDDQNMYVGAYLQETDITGAFQDVDSPVFQENTFEMVVDVDGTMHNFKQMDINAMGTAADAVYFSGPYDADETTASSWVDGLSWSAGMQKAVSVDGTLNQPGDVDRSWSVEWAFSFSALAQHAVRQQPVPADNEVWFANFGRSSYHLNVSNNQYVKYPGAGVDWWSWQPCGSVNILLQNRWGLIQFKKDLSDSNFDFQRWHLYKPLFDIFEALRGFSGQNSRLTDQLEELNLPPYIVSEQCIEQPIIQLLGGNTNFKVSVKSKLYPNLVGQIRNDRYVFFYNT